jgi:hypothetical protein
MPSAIILNVIMLTVVAPLKEENFDRWNIYQVY